MKIVILVTDMLLYSLLPSSPSHDIFGFCHSIIRFMIDWQMENIHPFLPWAQYPLSTKKRSLLPSYSYWCYNVHNRCPAIVFWSVVTIYIPSHGILLVRIVHVVSYPHFNLQLLHIWTLYLRPDGLRWDLLYLKFPCIAEVFTLIQVGIKICPGNV